MSEKKIPQIGDGEFRMPTRQRIEPGELVQGTVVLISDKDVFLDVGMKSEASINIQEFLDKEGHLTVKEGDKAEAFVVSVEPELVLSRAMAHARLNMQALEDAHDLGIPVEGKVSGVNKGGLEVDLAGQRAFCPVSQIDAGFCPDPSIYVGETLKFRVMEVKEGGRNIVLSRRALLEEERREAAENLREQLQEGAEFTGRVVSLQPYGAFVDIGGIQGMVHISEISHRRLEHPSEALREGQEVRVRVLRVDRDPKHADRLRVGLSIKAMLGDPWEETVAALQEGSVVEGEVVRLQPFGAFVQIAPGVDGLIHVSELADRRINHPSDVVAVGQKVTVTVLKMDRASRKLSLSMRTAGQASVGSGDLQVGSAVDVVVDRIKPFGLLVSVKGQNRGLRGLIPVEETGVGRQTNLRRAFPEGSEHKAVITLVEPDTGKMRLSIRAFSEQSDQEGFTAFLDQAGRGPGPDKAKEQSLGTLGDMLRRVIKDE